MVAMATPDKLCIVTYVSQYYNYFSKHGSAVTTSRAAAKRLHDDQPESGDVKRAVDLRKTADNTAPSVISSDEAPRQATLTDRCDICGAKVYVMERFMEGTRLYHRRCYRQFQRTESMRRADCCQATRATESAATPVVPGKTVPGPSPAAATAAGDVGTAAPALLTVSARPFRPVGFHKNVSPPVHRRTAWDQAPESAATPQTSPFRSITSSHSAVTSSPTSAVVSSSLPVTQSDVGHSPASRMNYAAQDTAVVCGLLQNLAKVRERETKVISPKQVNNGGHTHSNNGFGKTQLTEKETAPRTPVGSPVRTGPVISNKEATPQNTGKRPLLINGFKHAKLTGTATTLPSSVASPSPTPPVLSPRAVTSRPAARTRTTCSSGTSTPSPVSAVQSAVTHCKVTPVPRGSPAAHPVPRGSPAAHPVPRGSPAAHPVPRGSPAAHPVPRGSPAAHPVPRGSPAAHPVPRGSPAAHPVPRGSPAAHPVPQGSPSAPPVPRGSPSAPPVPRGSPSAPPVPQGSPSAPPVPQGSPSAPPVPQGSPSAPPVPRGSPSAPPVPQGSPSVPPVPQGSPSAPPVPQGSPSAPPVPQGSPSAPPERRGPAVRAVKQATRDRDESPHKPPRTRATATKPILKPCSPELAKDRHAMERSHNKVKDKGHTGAVDSSFTAFNIKDTISIAKGKQLNNVSDRPLRSSVRDVFNNNHDSKPSPAEPAWIKEAQRRQSAGFQDPEDRPGPTASPAVNKGARDAHSNGGNETPVSSAILSRQSKQQSATETQHVTNKLHRLLDQDSAYVASGWSQQRKYSNQHVSSPLSVVTAGVTSSSSTSTPSPPPRPPPPHMSPATSSSSSSSPVTSHSRNISPRLGRQKPLPVFKDEATPVPAPRPRRSRKSDVQDGRLQSGRISPVSSLSAWTPRSPMSPDSFSYFTSPGSVTSAGSVTSPGSVTSRGSPADTPRRRVSAEVRLADSTIQRRLEQLDQRLRAMETEGADLERRIRDTGDDMEDDDLMIMWFDLVNQKNELVRKESELMYRQRQQALEDQHAALEYQIRLLLDKPECERTAADGAREQALLGELVDVVRERSVIVDLIEEDRLRYLDEDKIIKDAMMAKGFSKENFGRKLLEEELHEAKKNKKKKKNKKRGKT